MAEPTEQMEGLNVGEGGELSKAQLKKLEAKRLKEAQKAEKAAAREAAEQARVSAVEDDPLQHLYGDLPLVQSQEQTGRVRIAARPATPLSQSNWIQPGSLHHAAAAVVKAQESSHPTVSSADCAGVCRDAYHLRRLVGRSEPGTIEMPPHFAGECGVTVWHVVLNARPWRATHRDAHLRRKAAARAVCSGCRHGVRRASVAAMQRECGGGRPADEGESR